MMKNGKISKKELKELEKQFPKIPKYLCQCMECGEEWETTEEYSIQSQCPYCKCGDIYYVEDDK